VPRYLKIAGKKRLLISLEVTTLVPFTKNEFIIIDIHIDEVLDLALGGCRCY